MKFDPFIAPTLRTSRYRHVPFGRPVQLSLMPEDQPGLNFALRLHHATYLHFDFRIQILNTLFCLMLPEPPSLDPARSVRAKLMDDHDPRHLKSEYVIPQGRPGAGPTMPVDLGKCVPEALTFATHEQEALHQIRRGVFRFTLFGQILRGGWRLKSGSGEFWFLQKVKDEHASSTQRLQLDRSIRTSCTLDELKAKFAA